MKDKDELEAMERAGKTLKGVYRLPGGGRMAKNRALDAEVLKWIEELKAEAKPKRPSRCVLCGMFLFL